MTWDEYVRRLLPPRASALPRHRVSGEGFDPDTGGFQWIVVDGERFAANEVGSWRLRIRRLKRQRDAAEKVARDLREERDSALRLLARLEAEPQSASSEAAAGSTPSPSPQGQPSSFRSGRGSASPST